METLLTRILLMLLLGSFTSTAFSQSEEVKVFEKVESLASTDENAFRKHVKKHSQLPDSAQLHIPVGTYKVPVHFVVDKHGYTGQFKVKIDPGYGLGNRAIQVIQSYPGMWKPASQCGRLVNSYQSYVVEFQVKDAL